MHITECEEVGEPETKTLSADTAQGDVGDTADLSLIELLMMSQKEGTNQGLEDNAETRAQKEVSANMSIITPVTFQAVFYFIHIKCYLWVCQAIP